MKEEIDLHDAKILVIESRLDGCEMVDRARKLGMRVRAETDIQFNQKKEMVNVVFFDTAPRLLDAGGKEVAKGWNGILAAIEKIEIGEKTRKPGTDKSGKGKGGKNGRI